MFTHFGHVLVDDKDEYWLVERTEQGVVMEKIDHDGSDLGQVVDKWMYIHIDMASLDAYLERQHNLQYDVVGKNCKHFCYDFRRELLGAEESFHDYCQYIEGRFTL